MLEKVRISIGEIDMEKTWEAFSKQNSRDCCFVMIHVS